MRRGKEFPKCTHREKFEQVVIPDEAFAHRLFQLGSEYGRSGEVLLTAEAKDWKAAYFLICHSIELLLKAYLSANKVISNKGEKVYQEHCLMCLWELSLQNGLKVDFVKAEIFFDHIRDYAELVRYPDVDFKQRIDAKSMLNFRQKVADAVRSGCQPQLFFGMLTRHPIIQHWHDRSLSKHDGDDATLNE